MTISFLTGFTIALVGVMIGFALKSAMQETTLKMSVERKWTLKIGPKHFYLVEEKEYQNLRTRQFARWAASDDALSRMVADINADISVEEKARR